MRMNTKYLGEIDVDKEKVIHFPTGLPGFQDELSFVLLDIPNNDILQLLQSVQTADLAFIVANPHDFYPDYTFNLEAPILEALQIKAEQDIVILSVMTIQEPFAKSTINLKAPIIIHANKKMGKQCILNEEKHDLKANIVLPIDEERGK